MLTMPDAMMEADRLAAQSNALWERSGRSMRVHDGFQVEAGWQHEKPVFRITIFGGGAAIGGPDEVRAAARSHVRRQRRRRSGA